jgi:hypothetical protein
MVFTEPSPRPIEQVAWCNTQVGLRPDGWSVATPLPAIPVPETLGDPLDGFAVLFVGGPAAGEVGEGDGAVEGEGLGEDHVLLQLGAGGGGLRQPLTGIGDQVLDLREDAS